MNKKLSKSLFIASVCVSLMAVGYLFNYQNSQIPMLVYKNNQMYAKHVKGNELVEINGNVYHIDDQGKLNLNVHLNNQQLIVEDEAHQSFSYYQLPLINSTPSPSQKESLETIETLFENMDDLQIKKVIVDSLLWKNEVTGETYRGIEQLSFGWNEDHMIYGGLILVENPYGVQFNCEFKGGIDNMITNNVHSLWLDLPLLHRQIVIDDILIGSGKSLTYNQRVKLYGELL